MKIPKWLSPSRRPQGQPDRLNESKNKSTQPSLKEKPLLRLPFRARILTSLVIVLPLTAYFIYAGYRIYKTAQLLNKNAAVILQTEIEKQLGHELRIGSISYTHPGLIVLNNIAVSNRKTFKSSHGQTVAVVDNVRISYDFKGLLADVSNPAHYITHIDVNHPRLLVERLGPKTFNFTDLLQNRRKKVSKPFVASISVTDASVQFIDQTAPLTHGRMFMAEAAHLNGVVDCGSDRFIKFHGTGTGKHQRVGNIDVTGDFSRLKTDGYHFNIKAQNGDAAYWLHYLHLVPKLDIIAGSGDVELGITVNPSNPASYLDIIGHGIVRNGVAIYRDPSLMRAPVTGVNGSLTFTESSLTGMASCRINGQPAYVQASIMNYKNPHLAMKADVRNIDIRRMAYAFPWMKLPDNMSPGAGTASLYIDGPLNSLGVSGNVLLNSATYQGNRLTNVSAGINYNNKILAVQNGSVYLNGAKTVFAGAWDTSKSKQTIKGGAHVYGIDLASLHMPGNTKLISTNGGSLGGKADIGVVLDSAGKNVAVANINAENVKLAGSVIDKVIGRVSYNDRAVEINNLTIYSNKGSAQVSGSVGLNKANTLDLNINAVAMRLSKLPYLSKYNVRGIGYFNGKVTGALADPHVAGSVHLFHTRYDRFVADVARSSIIYNGNSLIIKDLDVYRYPSHLSISGTLNNLRTSNPQLNLTAKLDNGSLQDITQMLGNTGQRRAAKLLPTVKPIKVAKTNTPSIKGEANGSFTIKGSLKGPTILGSVKMEDISINNNHLDDAQTKIAIYPKRVTLQNIVLRSGAATFTGEAEWSPKYSVYETVSGNMNNEPANWPFTAKFSGENIELERFRNYTKRYVDLHGSVNFSGSLTGSIGNPDVNFGIIGNKLAVDNQRLDSFIGFGHYANGSFTSANGPLEFTILNPDPQTGKTQRITYSLDSLGISIPTAQNRLTEPVLHIMAHIPSEAPEHISHIVQSLQDSRLASNPGVQRLVTQLSTLPQPFDGAVYVPSLTVDGPLSNLNGAATLELRDGMLGDNKVNAVTAGLTYKGGTNTVAVSANLIIENVNVQYIPAANPLSHVTASITRLNASVGYRQDRNETPVITAALNAPDLKDAGISANNVTIAGIPITSISASGSYSNDIITLASASVKGDRIYVAASGKADLNGDISANVDASHIPLSAINNIFPHMKKMGGEIDSITAALSGPTRSMDVMASINVTNPSMVITPETPKSKEVSYQLGAIRSGTISVASTNTGRSKLLSINNLSVYDSNGNTLAKFSGTMPFRWNDFSSIPTDEPAQARLQINDLSVLAAAMPLIDRTRTGGSLTATVDFNNPAKAKKVDGSIEIANAKLGITGVDTCLKDIVCAASFDQRQVTINKLTANSSSTGIFSVNNGVIRLSSVPSLDMVAKLQDFKVSETSPNTLLQQAYKSAATATVNGSFSITGPYNHPWIRSIDPLRLTSANIEIPSPDTTPSAEPRVMPIDPQFDITIQMDDRKKPVTIRKGVLLSASISGVGYLSGSASSPLLKANGLKIMQGKLNVPKIDFDSNAGSIDFIYDASNADQPMHLGLNNVEASAKVYRSKSSLDINSSLVSSGYNYSQSSMLTNDRPQWFRIKVWLSGSIEKGIQITNYESNPSLTRPEVEAALLPEGSLLAILNGNGNFQTAMNTELTSALNTVGLPMLLQPIESSLASILGLSGFSVEYTPDTPLLFIFNMNLGPKFDLTFERSYGARTPGALNATTMPPDYYVKLRYNLTRLLGISVSTDDKHNNAVGLDGVIQF